MIIRRHSHSTTDGNNASLNCIDRSEKRCPRLWNIVVVITFPILLLIFWSMFCGHFITVLESGEELNANNDAMLAHITYRNDLETIRDSTKNAYDECLKAFIAESESSSVEALNGTEMMTFMEECTSTSDEMSHSHNLVKDMTEASRNDLTNNVLSFNWNMCAGGVDSNYDFLTQQGEIFAAEWLDSLSSLKEDYITEGNTTSKAEMVAAPNVDISDLCAVNSAGGALFWFTIMTTIGYGNTSPVTLGGRAMVYTLGFFSILAFTACIGTSGHISLAITDDFFNHWKMRRLVKGWTSVLFWLSALWLWILANALMYYARIGESEGTSFKDSFWWAYISITTIGLGDIHIPHRRFNYLDAFYTPFSLLIAFVFLANFLLKLSEYIKSLTDKVGLTDDESLGTLLKLSRKASVPKNIDAGNGIVNNVSDLQTTKTDDIAVEREMQINPLELAEQTKVMTETVEISDDYTC